MWMIGRFMDAQTYNNEILLFYYAKCLVVILFILFYQLVVSIEMKQGLP